MFKFHSGLGALVLPDGSAILTEQLRAEGWLGDNADYASCLPKASALDIKRASSEKLAKAIIALQKR